MVSGTSVIQLGWYPEAFAEVIFIFAIYLFAVGPMRRRFSWGEPVRVTHIAWFVSGLAMFAIAEGTPLHDLAERYLFSAHMAQHILLVILMPAMIIKGLPPWLLKRLFLSIRPIAWIFRNLSRPVLAFLAFNMIFTLWHIPALYQAALENHDIHVLEHVLFFAAGWLLWWPLLSPLPESPRLSLPLQVVYIFLLNIAQIAVFGPITFGGRVFYPFYGDGPSLFGLTPITDQRLAGIIMKIPSMIIFVAVLGVSFFRWANSEAQSDGHRPQTDAKQSMT